jgi:CRISPR/Cas system type I-B associated protein Csh2 (Cas7 group RAMP superfamily)
MIVRGNTGVDADGIAETEADHFMNCPGCGEWFDMRELGQMLVHMHDAEIEIGEGPVAQRHSLSAV